MRFGIFIFLLFCLFIPVSAQNFVQDELIVQYHSAIDNRGYGLLSVDEKQQQPIIVSLSGETVQEAIQRLSIDPNISYVQPNYLYTLGSLPNDIYFGDMWGLYNTGQTVGSTAGLSGSDISWLDGMSMFSGIEDDAITGTIIGVIDNGIAYNPQILVIVSGMG